MLSEINGSRRRKHWVYVSSHAVRYIDSVDAIMKLQGILDVGILINKSNEKI